MKKYLVQFCLETDETTGKIGSIEPQYLPEKGFIAECSNEKLTNIMEGVFNKFPKYRTAVVSEFVEDHERGIKFFELRFIAVNNGWNGKKASGYAVDIPVDMFNMMG